MSAWPEGCVGSATHRFGGCTLDEACRSLTAGGCEIRLQPRAFDLLCYLVRHRERVVPKDELLDALWPGVVVIDNALQRVVSLVRVALAEAGLAQAIRTYPRLGYRFCMPDSAPLATCETSEHDDWPGALESYAETGGQGLVAPEDVEHWARAAICAGVGPSAVGALERLVAERDEAGDTPGAARATLLLAQIRIDDRKNAIARGLLQRVLRYLETHTDAPEHGYRAWLASRIALHEGDADEALARADQACNVGRAVRDRDVECLGLVSRGHALLMRGAIRAALAQHDEAAATLRLGGVRPWVAG